MDELPVQHVGEPPASDSAAWRVEISGEVESLRSWSLAELVRLSTTEIEADFHAASGWSVAGLRWRGARLADLLSSARPRADAHHVRFTDGGRYDSTLPLEAAGEPDVLLATALGGAPLPALHGGPVRLVVPSRYGWKSVKWLRGIELVEAPLPGFWERRGFHAQADPWKELRRAGDPMVSPGTRP